MRRSGCARGRVRIRGTGWRVWVCARACMRDPPERGAGGRGWRVAAAVARDDDDDRRSTIERRPNDDRTDARAAVAREQRVARPVPLAREPREDLAPAPPGHARGGRARAGGGGHNHGGRRSGALSEGRERKSEGRHTIRSLLSPEVPFIPSPSLFRGRATGGTRSADPRRSHTHASPHAHDHTLPRTTRLSDLGTRERRAAARHRAVELGARRAARRRLVDARARARPAEAAEGRPHHRHRSFEHFGRPVMTFHRAR